MNCAEYLLADVRSEDVAVIQGDRIHSYADLLALSDRVDTLLVGVGMAPGARVGLIGANSPFWIASYLAALRRGFVVVPFPTAMPVATVQRNLEWVGCAAVLMDRRSQKSHSSAIPAGVKILTEADVNNATPAQLPTFPTELDSDAALLFTSGTAGTPRAVRLTHRNIVANTRSIISYLELRGDDRILVILPFTYSFGLSLLNTHLRMGASLVLSNSFVYPETSVDLLERHACTELAGVPSSFNLLLRSSSFAGRTLPSLRLIQQAGGRLAPVLIEELAAAQPHTQLFIMYGQTEATARLSYVPPNQLKGKIGAIGRSIPGVTLRVVAADGREVGIGEVGEIRASGENISPGYYRDAETSAAKFQDGELRTGDMARVDQDGFIFVVDRKEDFIKSWGYRISSQEVEALSMRMPELTGAAALGVPDLEAGERVELVVTARKGAAVSEEDVLAFCREHLDRHQMPRRVHLVPALPLNASGKVAKSELRARFASVD